MSVKTLTDIIYQYKESEFTWGEFDCCVFTFKIVEEFLNIDIVNKWQKTLKYNNEISAKKTLLALGCKNLKDLPGVILNTKRKDISEVKLGEPVYYTNEDGVGILGVCNGKRAYFLQYGGGLTARPIEDCKYSWSINQ